MSVSEDLIAAINRLDSTVRSLSGDIQTLQSEISTLNASQDRSRGDGEGDGAGGGGGAGGAGGGGGGAGPRGAAGPKIPRAAQAGFALAGTMAANAARRGIVSGFQGGSVSAGAAGAFAGIAEIEAKVPVLGELNGSAPAVRVAKGTQQALDSRLGDLAAAGVEFSDEDIDALVAFEGARQERREFARQQVRRGTERQLSNRDTSFGFSLSPAAEALRSIFKQLDDSGTNTFR